MEDLVYHGNFSGRNILGMSFTIDKVGDRYYNMAALSFLPSLQFVELDLWVLICDSPRIYPSVFFSYLLISFVITCQACYNYLFHVPFIRSSQSFLMQNTLFYCASFYCTLQILCFLQIEGWWQSCVKHIYFHHFSNNICSCSLSHFGNSCDISYFFYINFVM